MRTDRQTPPKTLPASSIAGVQVINTMRSYDVLEHAASSALYIRYAHRRLVEARLFESAVYTIGLVTRLLLSAM